MKRNILIQQKHIIKSALSAAADLLFPPRCPLCEQILRRSERLICDDCRMHLPWIREPVCRKCGKPIGDETAEYCTDCSGKAHVFTRGRCVFLYEGQMRLSITRMKFHDKREYIAFYAEAMAQYLKQLPPEYAGRVVVPIPMHPKKKRERGYDQCALLAEKFAAAAGLQTDLKLLKRVRYTRAQKGLSYQQRQRNLQGAFETVRNEQLPERVLLVDDIYTTGTTMDMAAQALKNAGIDEICFLALCTGRVE